MQPRSWQALAIAMGLALLGCLLVDAAAGAFANADVGFIADNAPGHPGYYDIREISNSAGIEGPLRVGDRVTLEDRSLSNRLRYRRQRAGDRFAFSGVDVRGRASHFVATMNAARPQPQFWVYELTGLAFAVVGLLVALRRPSDGVARTMVVFFFSLGALWLSPIPWLPPAFAGAVLAITTAAQIISAYAALRLATTFPFVSGAGIRKRIAALNPWLSVASILTIFTAEGIRVIYLEATPDWLSALGVVETFAYFITITIAFVVAGRQADPADRKRLHWVSWTVAVGFSGSLVTVVQYTLKIPFAPSEQFLNFSLLAIPVGLGYAIVRHRVLDIGFVINRALVFGALSGFLVAVFMVVEWALSNAALRLSHVTSTSLELALALGLGFSMRSLHARVDRFVDDLFFRDRHEAERALRLLARDVAYIGDPRVAVSRVYEELQRRTGAASVEILVADGAVATSIAGDFGGGSHVGIDDGALVRMRASREPCELGTVGTALRGDYGFPMLVRDQLNGAVILGAKTNGEAYAPDEIATVERVALALGNALDALQTAALKIEIARVLAGGTSIDGLRATADPASWLRTEPGRSAEAKI
jgi:hypothetical protein